MDRRRFIELTAATAGTGVALAGCTGEEGSEAVAGTENDTDADTEEEPAQDEPEEEEPEPEPEGGDGRPYTHYDLNVLDKREAGQPVWIDRINGSMAVTISP